MSAENPLENRGENEPEEKDRIETVNERISELVRKEQGFDVKTQSKSKKGELNELEQEELEELGKEFKELGGMEEWHRLRKLKGEQ